MIFFIVVCFAGWFLSTRLFSSVTEVARASTCAWRRSQSFSNFGGGSILRLNFRDVAVDCQESAYRLKSEGVPSVHPAFGGPRKPKAPPRALSIQRSSPGDSILDHYIKFSGYLASTIKWDVKRWLLTFARYYGSWMSAGQVSFIKSRYPCSPRNVLHVCTTAKDQVRNRHSRYPLF